MLKNEYELVSRTGQKHHLIENELGWYYLQPAEEWMPIYVTGNQDHPVMIDTDGGPALTKGFLVEPGLEIDNIETRNKIISFHLKERYDI